MAVRNITHIVCPFCLVLKPRADVIISPAGFRSFERCKECHTALGQPSSPSQVQVAYGPIQQRECTTCGEIKNTSDFAIDLNRRWGITTWCRKCGSARIARYLSTVQGRNKRRAHDRQPYILAQKREARRIKRREKYRERNQRIVRIPRDKQPSKTLSYKDPNSRRERALRMKYGITMADYEKMNAAQNGLCAVCSEPNLHGRPLVVDHCHATNVVRGLLCLRCNAGMGNFRDSPELLEQAKRYALKHSQLKLVS